MIPYNEIALVLSTSLSSPTPLYNMVMEYSVRTGKDGWQCFGEAFAAKNTSILFEYNGSFIGYATFNVTDDDVLFFEHGFIKKQIDNVAGLMENIYNVVSYMRGDKPRKIELHSDLPPRLWKRWGFTESKVKIYERFIGGQNHG